MSGLDDREQGSKNSPVSAIVNVVDGATNVETEEKAKKKLRQQSYYLAQEHIQAIEMRLFKNKMSKQGETDKSALVRAALDKYLAEELQEIQK